jgi:hypothetical protein
LSPRARESPAEKALRCAFEGGLSRVLFLSWSCQNSSRIVDSESTVDNPPTEGVEGIEDVEGIVNVEGVEDVDRAENIEDTLSRELDIVPERSRERALETAIWSN